MLIHKRLCTDRRKKRKTGPASATVRRVLKSKAHQHPMVETCGRKRFLMLTNSKRLDKIWGELVVMADDNYEVHWADVIKKTGMPSVHRTTAAKNLRDAVVDIAARNAVRRPPKRRTPRSSPRFFRLVSGTPVNK